jgi:Uma2 family endonuclease
MSTAASVITPEELLEMGDEGKAYELVNGELKELIVTKESSHIAGEIYLRLKLHCDAKLPGWVFPEGASYCCFPSDEMKVRKPDTSFIKLDRMTREQFREEGHCPIVPDLVIEVISPNDNAEELEIKIEEWLAAGVKILWEVYPATRAVRVYGPNNSFVLLRPGDTLTAPDVLPGFACLVADLFRLPGEPVSSA